MRDTVFFSRNGLITDEYLRVKNSKGTIYAIGDCSVVEQEKIVESVEEWFRKADMDHDGSLTMEEFTGEYRKLWTFTMICEFLQMNTIGDKRYQHQVYGKELHNFTGYARLRANSCMRVDILV